MKRVHPIFLTLGFWLVACQISHAEMSKQKLLETYYDAGIAYKKGDYSEAIAKYETILNGQKESGNIYFNLANSYYKNNEIGKAVLNYERALRFISRDSDLLYNYNYVKGKVLKSQDWNGHGFVSQMIHKIIGIYTYKEWINLFTFFFLLALALHLLGLYFRWRKSLRKSILSLSLFLLILNIFFIGLKITTERNFSIIIHNVDAKFEPNERSTTHFRLNEGEKVKWVRNEYGWSKIKRADGKLGWIPKDFVEKI